MKRSFAFEQDGISSSGEDDYEFEDEIMEVEVEEDDDDDVVMDNRGASGTTVAEIGISFLRKKM